MGTHPWGTEGAHAVPTTAEGSGAQPSHGEHPWGPGTRFHLCWGRDGAFPKPLSLLGAPHRGPPITHPSTPRFCALTRREDNHLGQTKGQSHGKAAAPQIWLLSRRAGPGRLLSSAGGQRGRQKLRLLLVSLLRMSLLRADHRPLRPAVPEHGFLRNSFSCSHLIFLL